MIDKLEIIKMAAEHGFIPRVIEKDYVLGWLLWGIHGHEALAKSWIFKGEACANKCFRNTFQFSEDLDFTLTNAANTNLDFLQTTFAEIGVRIHEETGIEFPADCQRFEVYQNPRSHNCVQGRIGYRGPVSLQEYDMPRFKLDLMVDGRAVLPATPSTVFHPYSDGPADGIVIRSYPNVRRGF